jgi:alpha/beta superfamily hydrolase
MLRAAWGTSCLKSSSPAPRVGSKAATTPQKDRDAPIAIVLHPHPQFGGTMNNRVVYNLHYAFHSLGFTVLRFNFRGVGAARGNTTRESGSCRTRPRLWTTFRR